MKIVSKYISTLSDETINEVNNIHRYYIENEDIGESIDARMELHSLLINSIEEFVLNERIERVNETHNGDHIEFFLVRSGDGFIPSVRTSGLDAPASTIDESLAAPLEQAMVWGFSDAVIDHVLEHGIIG